MNDGSFPLAHVVFHLVLILICHSQRAQRGTRGRPGEARRRSQFASCLPASGSETIKAAREYPKRKEIP